MKSWVDVMESVKEKKLEREREKVGSTLDKLAGTLRVSRRLPHKRYVIDDSELYFTRREAHCMYYLLHGFTIHRAAKQLSLSPRTVEFYLKNIKIKFDVRTKAELIEKIMKTNFLDIIDFKDDM